MKHIYIAIYLLFISNLYAQDRTLFSIDGESVSVDDFIKTYDKNRLDDDTLVFSESLEEYLKLYINFKLKVIEAESLGLDTVPSFIRELEGYRRQLVKPYLTDTQVSQQLLIEAYERLKYEVHVSHILISVDENDTLPAYNSIMEIREKLINGGDFQALAQQFSDDPSAQENKGDLGYFTALYMVYPFETAAYETELGGISQPVKTRFGYHVLKVHDKRPSRGEVKVAHIMVQLKNQKNDIAKERINEIYDSLLLFSGSNFSELAQKYSDDKKSGSKGGELDWFGTNKMVKNFEEVAFSLDSVGAFSEPFQTEFGWHIIKLLDKKKLPDFDQVKESLKKKIERDSRSQKTRDVVIDRLKNEWGFVQNPGSLNVFYDLLDKDFFEGEDIVGKIKDKGEIMFLFNHNYDIQRYVYQKDFAEYLSSYRSRIPQNTDVRKIVKQFYKTFQEQKILEIESDNLEDKYDEFRLLIDEYHDGILLFNLSEKKIWNKAIQDTAGLQNFYKDNKAKYISKNRINATIYSSQDERSNKKVYNRINWGFSDADILKDVNKNSALNLSIDDNSFEKGENEVIDEFVFSLGWENLKKLQSNNSSIKKVIKCPEINKVIVIKDVIDTSTRPLNEIKGLVISDYQSFLEKKWLKDLKSKYNISINQDLFSLAKQQRLNYISSKEKFNQSLCDSFKSCFSQAGSKLGYSKDVYFGWKGMLYTTDIKR